MKTAIPMDENKRDICPSFGRAPYFLFTGEGEELIAENPAAQAQGGAGLQAAQFVVDNGAQVIITPRCGQNAGDVLKEAGLRIYRSQGSSARENLERFEKGELEELTHFHQGFHGIH